MILLFSKQDISKKIGIDPDETGEYLRLRLSLAGVSVGAKRFSPRLVSDILWDNMFGDSKSKSKSNAEIIFDSWSTSFKDMAITAIITENETDILQVELL